MTRIALAVIILMAALYPGALAQDTPAAPSGCPMCAVMGAAGLASWDGSVFLLSGGTLQKLDAHLQTIKTLSLPDAGCGMSGMAGGAACADCSHKMAQGDAAEDAPEPMAEPKPKNCSRLLTADSSGVYVLRCGTLSVFDHDLNQVASKRVVEVAAEGSAEGSGCSMCAKPSGDMAAGHEALQLCPMCAEKLKAGGGAEEMCPMCREKMEQMEEGHGEH